MRFGLKHGSWLEQRSKSDNVEDGQVQVLVAVVIPEFALLEVQIERVFMHASKLGKPGFGDTPEVL